LHHGRRARLGLDAFRIGEPDVLVDVDAAVGALDDELIERGGHRAFDADDLAVERHGVVQNIANGCIHGLRVQAAGKSKDKDECQSAFHANSPIKAVARNRSKLSRKAAE
jgi:hypothetical protein